MWISELDATYKAFNNDDVDSCIPCRKVLIC